MKTSSGIHHITAITGDPQKNLDFYEGFLGQRLVKRTVNFDDPRSYHFYYGDFPGSPGTLMTFFYWKGIRERERGVGEVSAVAYAIPRSARQFWMDRAKTYGIEIETTANAFGDEMLVIEDPDGIRIELVSGEQGPVEAWKQGPVPVESRLAGFFGVTLDVVSVEQMVPALRELGYEHKETVGSRARFVCEGDRACIVDLIEAPDLPEAQQGMGSVHHVAFRAQSDEDELFMRERIHMIGEMPTPVIDRNYFHSVYFMTPGRVLFEIATDGPGFSIDEDVDALGERLVLPAQYEKHRAQIEALLEPIQLPRMQKENL